MSETPRLEFNSINYECKVGDEILLTPDVEDVWDNEAPRLQIHVYKNDEYQESTDTMQCGDVDEDERWMFVERMVKKYAEVYARSL